MKHLILCKSRGIDFHGERAQVITVLDNLSDEEATKKAQEILDLNKDRFKDLEVAVFKGEFVGEPLVKKTETP